MEDNFISVMASDHQIENNTSLDTFINALDEINNLNIHIKDIIDKYRDQIPEPEDIDVEKLLEKSLKHFRTKIIDQII